MPREPDEHRSGTGRALNEQTLLEQLGGVYGMLFSAVPIVVFVVANSAFGLIPAIWSAVGSAAVIGVARAIRKETLQPAVAGLFGTGIAAFIAYRTGEARGFFLYGIWMSLLYCGIFVVSVAVRWPLVGVIWNFLNGTGRAWRRDKPSLHAYDIATLSFAVVFAARFVVQNWLYLEDETGMLAVARIAMGFPLFALALLVTIWAIRRSTKRLRVIEAETEAEETDAEIEQRLREKYSGPD
ncbi:DUF3159 domain-containing protein [Haloechinothrix aidingensis]|nr:DUF3159 domain-containing protein [Haloechinothrix aidingensis]